MLVERFQIMWPDGGASDLQVTGFFAVRAGLRRNRRISSEDVFKLNFTN